MDWSCVFMKTINLCQICGWMGGLGEGKEPQEKEQVSVPMRRPTEILLEKHKAADVGRNYSPSSVVTSVINNT